MALSFAKLLMECTEKSLAVAGGTLRVDQIVGTCLEEHVVVFLISAPIAAIAAVILIRVLPPLDPTRLRMRKEMIGMVAKTDPERARRMAEHDADIHRQLEERAAGREK